MYIVTDGTDRNRCNSGEEVGRNLCSQLRRRGIKDEQVKHIEIFFQKSNTYGVDIFEFTAVAFVSDD